jgi:hypothetical protein
MKAISRHQQLLCCNVESTLKRLDCKDLSLGTATNGATSFEIYLAGLSIEKLELPVALDVRK